MAKASAKHRITDEEILAQIPAAIARAKRSLRTQPHAASATGSSVRRSHHRPSTSIVGGGNPLTVFQGFMFDVKNGFFGSALTLQASDFQAAASASFGP